MRRSSKVGARGRSGAAEGMLSLSSTGMGGSGGKLGCCTRGTGAVSTGAVIFCGSAGATTVSARCFTGAESSESCFANQKMAKSNKPATSARKTSAFRFNRLMSLDRNTGSFESRSGSAAACWRAKYGLLRSSYSLVAGSSDRLSRERSSGLFGIFEFTFACSFADRRHYRHDELPGRGKFHERSRYYPQRSYSRESPRYALSHEQTPPESYP